MTRPAKMLPLHPQGGDDAEGVGRRGEGGFSVSHAPLTQPSLPVGGRGLLPASPCAELTR